MALKNLNTAPLRLRKTKKKKLYCPNIFKGIPLQARKNGIRNSKTPVTPI